MYILYVNILYIVKNASKIADLQAHVQYMYLYNGNSLIVKVQRDGNWAEIRVNLTLTTTACVRFPLHATANELWGHHSC